MALNLRQKQTECLTRMLNPSGNASKEVSYKILIYDEFCKNILAPLFHVKDLLKQRVTLRLLIDKDRKNMAMNKASIVDLLLPAHLLNSLSLLT
ncbi:unnamed protein product [Arabidopsis lyrata]|nr:unnamed protein product [Arabidopsis lyrata]